jgi:hypothetical protein
MNGRGEEVVAATGAVPNAAGLAAAHLGASAASCWTAKRLGLHGWLQRAAPQLAEVYAGAVTMAFDRGFPGRVVFVWHAMREIRNRLPDAVAGGIASSPLQYRDLADEIQRCWIEDGWPNDGAIALTDPSEPSASGPARHEVSRDLLLAVGRLVGGHAAIADRNQANAQRLFDAVAGSAAPAYVVRTWLLGGRQAHKLAHVQNKPVDPDDGRAVIQMAAERTWSSSCCSCSPCRQAIQTAPCAGGRERLGAVRGRSRCSLGPRRLRRQSQTCPVAT